MNTIRKGHSVPVGLLLVGSILLMANGDCQNDYNNLIVVSIPESYLSGVDLLLVRATYGCGQQQTTRCVEVGGLATAGDNRQFELSLTCQSSQGLSVIIEGLAKDGTCVNRGTLDTTARSGLLPVGLNQKCSDIDGGSPDGGDVSASLSVTLAGTGSGKVSSDQGGIQCTAGTCTTSTFGSPDSGVTGICSSGSGGPPSVNLIATADSGSLFIGWQTTLCPASNPSPSGSCMLKITHPVEVMAVFNKCLSGWCQEQSVKGPIMQDLKGIWGNSATDIWAVGYNPDPQSKLGATYHFDGNGWTFYDPGSGAKSLNAIWGSPKDSVIWTVGLGSASWDSNKKAWNTFPTHSDNSLRGIYGTGAGNVLAVGDLGTALLWQGEVAGWQPVAQNSAGTTGLDSVWISGTDVWAVGKGNLVVQGSTNSLNQAGKAIVGDNTILRGISGSSDMGGNKLWAVGDNGATYHWTGSWSKISGVTDTLNGVFVIGSDDVWAVGQNGAIQHWDGSKWSPRKSMVNGTLNSVWASGPESVWAVGDGGSILRHYPQ